MKAGWYLWAISVFVFSFAYSGYGQDSLPSDSLQSISNSVNKPDHSPKKAAYLSIVPGLGQIYNKKYWKVPVIYAALGTATYFWIDNNNKYTTYLDAYIGRIDDDTTNNMILPKYSTEDLRELKNYHWKYRDMSALIFIGIWALNILDATVDAHLYSFDISDDLSMRIQPEVRMPMGFRKSPTYGFSIALKF